VDELRRIRNEKGLSVRKLAKRAGINHSTLVHIETGKQSPNVATLQKLADGLGVEVGDFFPKRQAPLFPASQWEMPSVPGGRVEKKEWGNLPPPASLEPGGPQPGHGRAEELMQMDVYTAPAPEEFIPRARYYFRRIERGELTAEEATMELEREYATSDP
jgi:transcriptional regulator with XRE-family HTH domain